MDIVTIKDDPTVLNNYPDNSCSVDLGNILDRIPYENRDEVLTAACQKICQKGTITVRGVDIFSFAKNVLYYFKSLEQVNSSLGFISCETIAALTQKIESAGLKVIEKDLNAHTSRFKIVAERQ